MEDNNLHGDNDGFHQPIDLQSSDSTTSGTTMMDHWGYPERINVAVYPDRIEMIYKETSNITFTGQVYFFSNQSPEERVYKVVYSCIDGKWNESARIYGTIHPSQEEHYTFEDGK